MAHMWQYLLICLSIFSCFASGEETKWSRQLDGRVETDGDTSLDWIPLTQSNGETVSSSKDRGENARVLSYSQTYPPNARFVDFQKPQAPPLSQPQSYDFPYHFQRFSNNQLKSANGQPQEPTSQSFFKFEMPFRNDGGRLTAGQPPLQTGYQIQHSFGNNQGQATLYSSQLYNNQPLYSNDFRSAGPKPLQQNYQRKPSLQQQNFIDEVLPLKQTFRENKPVHQALQSVTPQVFPLNPKPDPTPFPAQSLYRAGPTSTAPTPQQEEVQLVYVPYDTFFNKQQRPQQQSPAAPGYDLNRFNLSPQLPAVNPYQINQFYTQDPLAAQEPQYYTPSTTKRPKTTSYNPILQSYATPQFSTPKPKPKAHQPPLAMFLMRQKSRPSQSDVVASLRNSETIDVIDGPTKDTPKVFVGPAGMPIPDGFVKFDLPYLSQLAQSSNLNDVPFFVAPLSYRTPNGFNKILLPEPHVGSIVVNRAKDVIATTPVPPSYTSEYNLNEYTETTTRPRVHHQRPKHPSSTKSYYPEQIRDPGVKTRTQYEVSTQRSPQSVRGNKFTYYVDQEVSPEVTKVKTERPKKKRPQNVQVEQPQYNQIANDEFYKLQSSKAPTSTSTSTTTSTTTTTTSTLPPPTTYFPYNSSPQVEFHSSNGQLYPSYNSIVNSQVPDSTLRFTTKPSTTADDEEYRIKQYYRQQDTMRQRPQNLNPTYSPFEQVQYTPIEVTIPSSTTKPGKQRFTYYTPMDTTTASQAYDTSPPQSPTEKTLPANHRPSYNPNEISDGNLEYEPNPYQLPSELPPLTPNLPGLVNNLQAQLAEQTTPMNEVEIPTRATRRPIHRVRKPSSTKVTSSVSYSESETTAKRPSHRLRRPYGTRGSTDVNSEFEESETTTRRTSSFSTRSPTVRNPNRIRYQPTPEERQSFRIKNKKGSKKGETAEDLDYQRDVLKQNYPVFRPSSSSRKTTSPTAIPSSYAVTTSENPTSESQQVYTVTPSSEQIFPAGMLEPMQIAQQYNHYSKDNYGPGYFPNQEELNPTEPVRNELSPIYTASTTASPIPTTTTTTETPQTTTKRSLFVRRNYARLRPTTTEAPVTTTQAPEERQTARPRIPPRKVIKVRTRNRRPLHPVSSSQPPPEDDSDAEPVKQNYRKLNRFNQDLYENDTPKRRYKTQFHLEGQESQWSPSTDAGSNNFNPVDPKDAKKESNVFQNEPEIVTIGPETENKSADTFDVKVSADYGSKQTNSNYRGPNLKPEKSFAELLEEVMGKPPVEKPLDEEREEDSTAKTTDGTYFESQKTTISNKLNRRGKWKKLRNQASNHQNDSFEAAESKNLGEQLLNKYYTDTNKFMEQLKSTTPLSYATESSTSEEYPVTEYVTENSVEAVASTQPETTAAMNLKSTTDIDNQDLMNESSTRRLDIDVATEAARPEDLDSEPSIFSEVKKQLHELFAIDDKEDQAVTAALSAVKRRHEYTNIKRTRPPLTTTQTSIAEENSSTTANVDITTELPIKSENKENSFKNPMEHLVYATSTATKVSSETEICYRGRCIKSEDLPRNHKLQ